MTSRTATVLSTSWSGHRAHRLEGSGVHGRLVDRDARQQTA